MNAEIGLVGPAGEDDFATNIAAGLATSGFSTHHLGGGIPSWLRGRWLTLARMAKSDQRIANLAERSIVAEVRERGIELVVTVISLSPNTVESLTRQGTRVVLWFPDAVSNLGALEMFDAPYHALFFKEPSLVRRMNSMLKLPIHYLPEACNPAIHRPVKSAEASGNVVVVGNLHAVRARLLERLAADGIPLSIYGDPRHVTRQATLTPFHQGRYVRGVEKSAVFRSAAAVLNNLHPAEIEGMNCRLFEATAAGGAVVTEFRPVLPDLFEPGREVLSFESYDELLEQLRRLVGDPHLGRGLGDRASARAHEEHTYERRLRILLEHAC